MYDAKKVAEAVRWHLNDIHLTAQARPPVRPSELKDHSEYLRAIETVTVNVLADDLGEHQIVGRIVHDQAGMAYSIAIKDAMERAAAEQALDAEIICNTPVEWLLVW